ncbi:MAG: hypothetical protein FJ291_22270 [Planctomycetes bacterium]|nr:hypothetical protein [Planctomycetota bacterium]
MKRGTRLWLAWVALLGWGFAWGAEENVGASGLEGLPIPAEAVKLVDAVRCGEPNDPHQVADHGRPSRIETVLGRPARVAAGAWEVFGYTLKLQDPAKPHLIVVTYPDDAARRVHFRVWGPQGGYSPVRAGLSTVQSAAWKINTGAWARTWTPLFIPGGKGSDVRILFADSRKSRGLAPNHQGPNELAPWAVGEILLYEVADPARLLPPLAIAHPVKPEEKRYFGFSGLGYAESYLRDAAAKDYMKLYLRYIGLNFLRVAGGQGGPPFGQPQLDNQLALLDELGLRTSFAMFKYFNAFLMDRIKSKTLPQELIDTMPKPIKDAIDALDGWRKPEALYEGGSYDARLMVMPLNWLDPTMGPWLEKLVQHYVGPVAKHRCVASVQFFGTGGGEGLAKAVERFAKAVRALREDLAVEVPSMYMNLRARERANLPVPYTFDYKVAYATTDSKGKVEVHDRVGLYDGWPARMQGAVGGIAGSLWRGFHVPPPGLAILDSPEALAAVRRFDDGWFAEFRVFEQNESESPKGIGWINDYYAWADASYRANIVKIMAANPRFVIINNGHEGTAWAETNLRRLAGAWRAFPWGKVEDVAATLAPRESKLAALRCGGRLLLLNLEPARRVAKLPSDNAVDAVTGEAVQGRTLAIEPFDARTVLLDKPR